MIIYYILVLDIWYVCKNFNIYREIENDIIYVRFYLNDVRIWSESEDEYGDRKGIVWKMIRMCVCGCLLIYSVLSIMG